ncbi:hypothetical protein [Mycobacterium botniense]|uniref:Uncharacterized protein n=1 Tax=Mycobacterium botniense TaxID=84962 RepID=A0A7I9Y294_9MYCO|nr:hypothetical protein [Mycobacterium botniense]GFG76150.1 hypothetical protein MBOT_35150 [Mycobacterium botniense]
MSETAEKIERVTLCTLKQRGWTDGAVKRFLGEPDALVTNPNYRSGPRMRLYDLPRVELIRERVLNAIADQYPYLAAECARQKAQRP